MTDAPLVGRILREYHEDKIGPAGVRGAGMDARLARLRNGLAVSQPVAELASTHLGEPTSRYAEPGSSVAGGTGA